MANQNPNAPLDEEEAALLQAFRAKRAASSKPISASTSPKSPPKDKSVEQSVEKPEEKAEEEPEKQPEPKAEEKAPPITPASESATKSVSEGGSHDSSPDKSIQELLSPKPSPVSLKSKPPSNPGPSVATRLKHRKRSSQALVPYNPQPKEEKPSKRSKGLSLSASSSLGQVSSLFAKRKILKPLIIGKEFWTQELEDEDEELFGEALDEFHSLLQYQGWDEMLFEPFSASDEVVRLFYQSIEFVPAKENSPCNDAILIWKGTSYPLSANLIASALGIESRSGFGILPQKKGWPKGKGFKSKGAVVKKIYDGASPLSLETKDLSIANKLLHFWITRNLVPRQEHRNDVLITDAIFMDKVLSGVQLDLPRLVLAHMQFCSSHPSHALPFPHIIKTILSNLNQYPDDLPETVYSKCLTIATVRKLKTKEQQPNPSEAQDIPPKAKASSQGPSSSHPQPTHSSDSSAILSSLDRIEKAITEGSTAIPVAIRDQVQELGKISSAVISLVEALQKDWKEAIGAHQATGQHVGTDDNAEEEEAAALP